MKIALLEFLGYGGPDQKTRISSFDFEIDHIPEMRAYAVTPRSQVGYDPAPALYHEHMIKRAVPNADAWRARTAPALPSAGRAQKAKG